MSKEKPYEFVPTYALAVLADHYEQLIKSGFFKLQKDLDLMKEELNKRFAKPEEDRQITIEEYMRGRKKDGQ